MFEYPCITCIHVEAGVVRKEGIHNFCEGGCCMICAAVKGDCNGYTREVRENETQQTSVS